MKDIVPWVRPESSRPSDLEEKEEEEMTGLLDRYAARKRKRYESFERDPIRLKDRIGLTWMGIRKCRRLSFRARLR